MKAEACTAGDFTLASAAPLHAMLQEGIIDKNVKFTPVLEGFRMPEYFDWELQPFTNHKVLFMLCESSCLVLFFALKFAITGASVTAYATVLSAAIALHT